MERHDHSVLHAYFQAADSSITSLHFSKRGPQIPFTTPQIPQLRQEEFTKQVKQAKSQQTADRQAAASAPIRLAGSCHRWLDILPHSLWTQYALVVQGLF